jgi:hypothetical protein
MALKDRREGYFAAVDGFRLPALLAAGCVEVRRRRSRTRFLAWERLRVFSRALILGAMVRISLESTKLYSDLLNL